MIKASGLREIAMKHAPAQGLNTQCNSDLEPLSNIGRLAIIAYLRGDPEAQRALVDAIQALSKEDLGAMKIDQEEVSE